jgi:hypothetical protein
MVSHINLLILIISILKLLKSVIPGVASAVDGSRRSVLVRVCFASLPSSDVPLLTFPRRLKRPLEVSWGFNLLPNPAGFPASDCLVLWHSIYRKYDLLSLLLPFAFCFSTLIGISLI